MWLRYWNVDWLPSGWGNVHKRTCLARYFYHLKHTVFWIYILLINSQKLCQSTSPEVVGYWNIFAVARLCDNHVTHLTWGSVDKRTGHPAAATITSIPLQTASMCFWPSTQAFLEHQLKMSLLYILYVQWAYDQVHFHCTLHVLVVCHHISPSCIAECCDRDPEHS